jgi:hypothetical protein
MSKQYSEGDLRTAANAGVIGTTDLERLLAFLAAREPAAQGHSIPTVRFDAAHLLWYAGALIVIGAMGIFSTVAFSQTGGRALTICALTYAVGFTLAGHYLWHGKNLQTPGGLLIAIAVSMAPLAVYGIQDELGWWPTFGRPGTVHDFYVWIKGSWIFMEIATVVAGVTALRFYRFPFIVSMIAIALWFMSMDLTPWVFGTDQFDYEMRRRVSVWFGLGVVIIAWLSTTVGAAATSPSGSICSASWHFGAALPQPRAQAKPQRRFIACSMSACCSSPSSWCGAPMRYLEHSALPFISAISPMSCSGTR